MFMKSLSALVLSLFATLAMASVDVNKADQTALESVKGIGPALSAKILAERKSGAFKDWPDLMERIVGVGPKSAVRLSQGGLTVNGNAFGAKPEAKAADARGTAAAKPAVVAATAPQARQAGTEARR